MNTDRAHETEKCSDLELPLPDNPPLFWKKDQGKQGGDDDGRTDEDGIDGRSHMEESDRLGDLMNGIWDRGDEAGEERTAIEVSQLPPPIEHERQDGEAGNGISIEILCPRIVELVEIVLEKRRGRPNNDGAEDCSVSAYECFTSLGCHIIEANGLVLSDWKERKAGLQLIYVSI